MPKRIFKICLTSSPKNKEPRPRDDADHLRYLREGIEPHLKGVVWEVYRTHPNFSLERLMKAAFERVPGVPQVRLKHGRGDKGADLEVDIEAIPGLLQTLVVQVKSYEGELRDVSAVKDIERTIGDAHMGLIVSTATSVSESVETALDELHTATDKPVALLYGSQLAAFVLKHMPNLA